MQICKIGPDKLRGALDLVWETFMKYEAPDYGEMGIATFRHFVTYSNMVEKVNQGRMTFWGMLYRQAFGRRAGTPQRTAYQSVVCKR